jgi:polysaccharide biosynthesis protein PslG
VRYIAPAVLCALAVVLSPSTAAAAGKKAIWGPLQMSDGSSALPIYQKLGVRYLQASLPWAAIAPTRPARPTDPRDPAYQWPSTLDGAIRAAQKRGIRIALMVASSPPWANGGLPHHWAPRNRAFANFVTAAARRYPGVRHWMIWGEPNRVGAFAPLPANSRVGPRRYATLLRAGYRALKRVRRRNIVIGGMSFTYGEVLPRDWARWMRLPNGKPAPLDWYGHNPFSFRFPILRYPPRPEAPAARDFSDLDTFYRELRRIYRGEYPRFRRRGPKLWISEFTISSDRGNHDFNTYVTRRQQARWLSTAYQVAEKTPYIAALGWFNLMDEPPTVPWGLTTGLLTWDGKPKPAYHAYRRAP